MEAINRFSRAVAMFIRLVQTAFFISMLVLASCNPTGYAYTPNNDTATAPAADTIEISNHGTATDTNR